MATTISLNVWLGYLILREKRKQDDSYKRDEDVDKTNNFFKKNKGAQLEYIETAVSVALLVVQTLIMSTSSIAGQQITIDNFTVVIDDIPNLEENPDDESLQRIIESVSQLKFTPINSTTNAEGEQQESNDVLLREVGTILHQLFCRGINPAAVLITDVCSPDEGDSNEDHLDDSEQPGAEKGRAKYSMRAAQKMLRRASVSSQDEHLLSYGVPRNLSRMVIDLIMCWGGNEETKFRSIEGVAEELMQIISKQNVFFYDKEEGDNKGQLRLGIGNTPYTADGMRRQVFFALQHSYH